MEMLSNKLIVITGASSGVGKAMALEFARYNTRLVLAARRSDALREVADECAELGSVAEVVVTDMRNISEVRHLAGRAQELGNSIDVWINNAGVLAAGPLDETPIEVSENVIRTNLIGYMNGAHAVLPYFKNQERGILINNISVGGWFPTPYAAAYTASKFGIRGFFEALKAELNDYPDIHIVDLFPGFLDTPGMQHAANYTGKSIRPAPPVYDPRKVAREVVNLVRSPKSSATIGASPVFLRLAYSLMPAFTRNITATIIRRYLRNADPIELTSGNVLQPVDFGTGVDGSWRLKQYPRELKTAAGIFLATALAGYLINAFSKSRKT